LQWSGLGFIDGDGRRASRVKYRSWRRVYIVGSEAMVGTMRGSLVLRSWAVEALARMRRVVRYGGT